MGAMGRRRRTALLDSDVGYCWLEHSAGGAIAVGRRHPLRVDTLLARLSYAATTGVGSILLRTPRYSV